MDLSLLESLLLGLVQGLTEFLPVSSSGHLVIVQSLLGLHDPEALLAFDLALHFATLVAVIAALWRDILSIRVREALVIGLATVPAALVGFFLKDWLEPLFASPRVAGGGLLITALVLTLTRWADRRRAEGPVAAVSWRQALAVGCFQAIAIVPGISRSGSTIAAGLFVGLPQLVAAKFSFLLSIPVILGGVVLESGEFRSLPPGPIILGMITASVSGYLAIRWLLKIVAQGRLYLFSVYCAAVGLAVLLGL